MSEPPRQRAKRSLGQNFLVDPNLQRKIVAALGTRPDDEVVEIGPGKGALTRHLLGTVDRLVLVELDNALAGERRARNAYQAEQNRKRSERFAVEEQRYKEIRDFLDVHRRLVQGLQKQVTAVQEDATRLRTTTAALETNQNSLIGKVGAARELSNLSSQKIDAIARSQAALYDDLMKTMSQVDSLYTWKKN